MRKIFFENLKKLTNCHDISNGLAKVYNYKNDEVIKIIDKNHGITADEEKIIELSQHNNDSYLFPKALAYVGTEFIGYTKEYVNGIFYYDKNILSNVTKEELEKAKNKFISDTKKLSEDLLLCFDLRLNIVFDIDKKRFVCIDTDKFQKAKNIKEALEWNIPYITTELKVFESDFISDKQKVRELVNPN